MDRVKLLTSSGKHFSLTSVWAQCPTNQYSLATNFLTKWRTLNVIFLRNRSQTSLATIQDNFLHGVHLITGQEVDIDILSMWASLACCFLTVTERLLTLNQISLTGVLDNKNGSSLNGGVVNGSTISGSTGHPVELPSSTTSIRPPSILPSPQIVPSISQIQQSSPASSSSQQIAGPVVSVNYFDGGAAVTYIYEDFIDKWQRCLFLEKCLYFLKLISATTSPMDRVLKDFGVLKVLASLTNISTSLASLAAANSNPSSQVVLNLFVNKTDQEKLHILQSFEKKLSAGLFEHSLKVHLVFSLHLITFS